MLSRLAIGCITFALAYSRIAFGGEAQIASTRLSAKLENVDHIALYFVAKTDSYSLNTDEIKRESYLRVYRKCGANCGVLMNKIVSHLEHSTPVRCSHGQQNLLIEVGDKGSLIYNHSGRMINFDGKCFFNKESVNKIVESDSFIFQ